MSTSHHNNPSPSPSAMRRRSVVEGADCEDGKQEQNIRFTDAIVPIYCDDKFMGTGFIYKSYLITAEHVLREYKGVYNDRGIKVAQVIREYDIIEYEYKGVRYQLRYDDALWSIKQYGNHRVWDFIDEDLAIYVVPIENDCLALIDHGDFLEKTVLYGYHYYDDNNIKLRSRELKISEGITLMDKTTIIQDKCLFGKTLGKGEDVIEGYSGGPVLFGNKVVGMLVGGPLVDSVFHLMKSSYILKTIQSLN